MRELPPDRRADLRHLLGGAEPVEPRHQRGVQACRDRQGRRRNRRNRAPGRALALRLQHRLRHLLHEQGNAVGALDDLRHHIRRQLLVPDQARDDGGRFTLPKPVERQARHMRLSHPRRVELGAERYDQQHRKGFNPVHGPTERFQARRIDPMRILEDHQHRLLACQSRELRRQRFQRSLPALFRGQLERGIASIIRERQHLGEECGILDRGRGLCEHRIELVELRLRCVVVRQSGGALHLADDRIKRAVGVLRRAEIAQARVRFAGEAFQKRRREPRLADTGLAGEQHHLAFAGLCPRPAPKKQFEFFFPPDQGGQTRRVQCLEAAFRRTRPQRRPGSHRPGDTLEVLRPEVLELEQIAEELPGAFGDDHRVRLGDPLQTRRKVRRLADDAALLRLSRSDQVADDDQSGGNANAGLQGSRAILRQATAAINSSPARTARSASSSCACG